MKSYLDVASHYDADDGRTWDHRVTRCLPPRRSCNQLILRLPFHVGSGDLDTALMPVEVANPCGMMIGPCGMAIGPYCMVIALLVFI